MNQFFYTRREPVAPKEGETEISFYNYKDSFNINSVIRSFEYEQGKICVILNDGHEETRLIQQEEKNLSGKVTKPAVKERNWFVSQLFLNEEDTKRFWETCGA